MTRGFDVTYLSRTLTAVSPRAASVTLLLFDRVVERYHREKGYRLSEDERETILAVLRDIARRDCQP
ncbi:MAG: hypothetical protein HYY04_15910 [Chloroflexi bacterium]|nr:hypothetical protein [Chloroflexota bacterium]